MALIPFRKRTMKRLLITSIAVAGLLLTPAAAHAIEPVNPDVAYALATVPGGVLMDPNSAQWPSLGMRIDALPTAGRAIGSCATGSICAYSSAGLSGTRLSWTTCGSKSTAALTQVGSIANARTSGTMTARAGSTARASATAGTSADIALIYRTSITTVSC